MTSPTRPRTKSLDRTSVQVIGQETLIYDELHHQAWCLNPSSACIWRLCDGQKTVEQIAAAASAELDAPVTDEIVLLALAEFQEKNLLEPETVSILPENVSRRRMLTKAGLAAAALLPVVSSIMAPPARAQGGSQTGMVRPKNPPPKG
ncbi:MAG TPA: PqqD family protein [Terracidiphilus sp.]|nr:PqqD family protein [Terracidiphilus sp.]